MAVLTLWRIETFCGMCWTGAGFSYDEADAETYSTDDEALEEITALGLQDVFVEKFERYSARETPKVYAATEARAA